MDFKIAIYYSMKNSIVAKNKQTNPQKTNKQKKTNTTITKTYFK